MQRLNHPPRLPHWIDSPHLTLHLGDFELESGERILDSKLTYVIHGQLNEDASNAILALPAIASTHHRLDFLIGKNKAFDPQEYCIICPDTWGNGLASSPSNSSTQSFWNFPVFGIRDMVQSQKLLLEHLGINKLQAVVGASMGGMQALQWGVSFPQSMHAIVAMTAMTKTSVWSIAVNEVSRRILKAGGNIDHNASPDGWGAWVGLMQLLAARTPQALESEFSTKDDIVDFLNRKSIDVISSNLNAVDWFYQTLAYDAHDLDSTPHFQGSTASSLESITAKVLLLAPDLDLYNPPQQLKENIKKINCSHWAEIPSFWGHQAATPVALEDDLFLNNEIKKFLKYR